MTFITKINRSFLPASLGNPSRLMIPAGREKAGLPQNGLDKERIDAIIREASAGSRFTAKQRRREEQLEQRIAKLKEEAALLSKETIRQAEAKADRWLTEPRQLDRVKVHIDMDAFFAAVEALDDPSLKDIPMAVGGEAMLSTANYEARKWGVSAAMPGYIARKLCPHLRIVPPRFERYRQLSEIVQEVLRRYDPNLRPPWSLDEAALDLTGNSNAEEVVREMRAAVQEATGGLTCSAGIAPTAALAKMCSNRHKPNGQFCLAAQSAEDVIVFLHPLPLRKINGVGPVTARLLEGALGVRTCGEAWEKRGLILSLLGRVQAEFILRSAIGLECHEDAEGDDEEQRSISVERTVTKALNDLDDQLQLLRQLAAELSEQLENMAGKTVSIKLKTVNFDTITRAHTLSHPINQTEQLYQAASKLLLKHRPAEPLRLMGIRLSNLTTSSVRGEVTMDKFFSKKELLTCPVCMQDRIDPSNPDSHLDECLTRRTLSQEEKSAAIEKAPSKRKGTLDHFITKKMEK